MTFKKHYLIIALLTAAGISASLVLLPGQKDVALMNLKDKRFEEAKTAYEQQLAGGNITIEVVMPLVNLYLQYAQVDEAIKVMEQYIAANPTNIDARHKLGTLYQYAQRPEDYLRNLEEINKLQPTEDTLKQLAELYKFNAQYDKQAEAIQQIVQQDASKTPEFFRDLANILAAQKKAPEATLALRAFKASFPDQFGFNQIELLVSLLMDQQKSDEALAEASEWVARTKDPEHIARLANVIHYKGDPKRAYELITPYLELAAANTNLKVEQITLYIANDRADEAFTMMDDLYQANALPANLYGTYIDSAIRRKNFDLISTLASKLEPGHFGEAQIIYLVEIAQVHVQPKLLAVINTKFGTTENLEKMPVFAAVLASANKDPKAKDKIAAAEAKPDLTPQQLIQLSQACARLGDGDCALRLMKRLPSFDTLSDNDINSVGYLYIQNQQFAEGFKFITEMRAARPEADLEATWAKLATGAGKRDVIDAWLHERKTPVSKELLAELYFIAINNGQLDLGIDLAERLFKIENTPNTRSYLAGAYLKAKKYELAIPVLREDRSRSKVAEDTYLSTLAKVAPKNAELRNELVKYVSERLASGKEGDKRKQELVYILINNGRADLAMPLIRKYALAGGASWASLYEGHLRKRGDREGLRKFWVELAAQPRVSTAQKRNAAFGLLNAGYKEDALAIFKTLAASGSVDSPDVKQVLFLNGPRPNAQTLAWMESRAASSKGKEAAAWLQLLYDYGGHERVITQVERNDSLMQYPGVRILYLNALARNGSTVKLGEQVTASTANETNVETLRTYAHIAQQNFLVRPARSAYEKLISIKPNDQEALLQLGVVAHTQSNYKAAKQYLAKYLEVRKNSAEKEPEGYKALFYYGELLRREKREKEAAGYYQAVLDSIATAPVQTAEMRSITAQSLFRLGRVEEADLRYQELMRDYEGDPILTADYMGMLIEAKRYKAARALGSGQATPAPVALNPLEPVVFDRTLVRNQTLTADGRELLLTLNTPTDKVSALTRLARNKPQWVNYVTLSYDQVLIAAADGYRITLDTQPGQLHIAGAKAARELRGELKEQADLRLNLLDARVDLESGHHYRAAEKLVALNKKKPNDAQLMGYTANAEYFIGRWRNAHELLEQANTLAPENEDIAKLLKDVRRSNAQHVKVDHMWRSIGRHNEQITTLSGFWYAQPFLRIGGEFQNDVLDAKRLRRADGRVGSFDETKQRGEIYVQYDWADGLSAKGSLFANNDTAGLGGQLSIINPLGKTTLQAELHKPYWEFVEGVLDDANRDRIGIAHEAKINQDVTLTGGVAYNRYNVADEDDVAQTVTVNASATYRLIPEQPFLAIGYALDAEYRTDHLTLRDATGTFYNPTPLTTREVHSLNLLGRYEFTEATVGDAVLGYSVDRFGGDGPGVELRLTHAFTDYLEGQLRAGTGIRSSQSDDDYTHAGGYMMWRF